MYPAYDWFPWKFSRSPVHFWNEVNNQRRFMDWAGKELQIKEMSDWYKIMKDVYFSSS